MDLVIRTVRRQMIIGRNVADLTRKTLWPFRIEIYASALLFREV